MKKELTKQEEKEMADELYEQARDIFNVDDIKDEKQLSGIGVPSGISEFLTPPSLILVQPTSPELKDNKGKEAKPGQFYNGAKAQIYDDLKIVILGFKIGRVMFNENKGERKLVCRSYDSETSIDGERCADCVFSQWTENNPPECKQYFQFLCVDMNNDLFVLKARGASFSAGRQIVNDILGSGKPLFSYKLVLGSEQKEGNKGRYYVLRIMRDEKNNLTQVKKYASMAMEAFGYKKPFAQRLEAGKQKKESKTDKIKKTTNVFEEAPH